MLFQDTYSLASQRQLCGASERAVDLLPDPQVPGTEWAENMQRDKGRAADSSMVMFDGQGGVTIPESVLPTKVTPFFLLKFSKSCRLISY